MLPLNVVVNARCDPRGSDVHLVIFFLLLGFNNLRRAFRDAVIARTESFLSAAVKDLSSFYTKIDCRASSLTLVL